jgi:hypothetical protein
MFIFCCCSCSKASPILSKGEGNLEELSEEAPSIFPEGERNIEDRSEDILELSKPHSLFLFPLGRIG